MHGCTLCTVHRFCLLEKWHGREMRFDASTPIASAVATAEEERDGRRIAAANTIQQLYTFNYAMLFRLVILFVLLMQRVTHFSMRSINKAIVALLNFFFFITSSLPFSSAFFNRSRHLEQFCCVQCLSLSVSRICFALKCIRKQWQRTFPTFEKHLNKYNGNKIHHDFVPLWLIIGICHKTIGAAAAEIGHDTANWQKSTASSQIEQMFLLKALNFQTQLISVEKMQWQKPQRKSSINQYEDL